MNDIMKRLRQIEQDDPHCKAAMFSIADIRALVAVVEMLTEVTSDGVPEPVLIFSLDCGTLTLNGKEIGHVEDEIAMGAWMINLTSAMDYLTIPYKVIVNTVNGSNMEYSHYGRVPVV